MTQETKTISMQMNWQYAVPLLVAVLQCGNLQGREYAKKELMKLAKGMDDLNGLKYTEQKDSVMTGAQ